MAALTSPNLGLLYGRPLGDGPWDEDFNRIVRFMDALLHLKVLSTTTAAPPGSPTSGDCYIVPVSATGGWAGKDKQIAYFLVSVWIYFSPKEGMRAYLHGGGNYQYDGAAWAIEANLIPQSDEFAIGAGGPYTLSASPSAAARRSLFYDGIKQPIASYTLSGSGNRTLTLIGATPSLISLVTFDYSS